MQGKARKMLAATLALSMTLGMPAGAALASGTVTRLGGASRYDTMSQIVSTAFSSSKWAVIATGENYPDALAASALAGTKECPLILTRSGELSAQARQQIVKLGVKFVYVMGGSSAVSDTTYKALEDMGLGVTRVNGDSRVTTSLTALIEMQKASTPDKVIIASGSSFADALAISPYAYKFKVPIVLTDNDGTLSDAAVKGIKDANIKSGIVVGGSSVVNYDEVKKALGFTPKLLAGVNRYDTAKEIVDWEITQGMNYDGAAVATGETFPDALSGSALCGSNDAVMVLTNTWNSSNVTDLVNNAYQLQNCYVLGGTGAVSGGVETVIKDAVDSAEYFERVDTEGNVKRFESVEVALTGAESNSVTMKPNDEDRTLYSGEAIVASYDNTTSTTSSEVSYRGVTRIVVMASNNDLILKFETNSGSEEVRVTNVISDSGKLRIRTTRGSE